MQSLERFVDILRTLASAKETGLNLTEVAAAIGLGKPTTMRLLGALCGHGLVEVRKDTKTYGLGPELVFLGLSASRSFSFNRLARPMMERLAAATGDGAFLSVRRGTHTLAVDRVFGDFPVQARTIHVGGRRPMGVGSSGVAILAALPPAEAEAILEANASLLMRYPGFSAERIRREVETAREKGYSYTQGHLVPDVNSIGHAVRDPLGNPIGAVNLTAIASRFTNGRFEDLLGATRAAARDIEKALAEDHRPASGSRRARGKGGLPSRD